MDRIEAGQVDRRAFDARKPRAADLPGLLIGKDATRPADRSAV